MTASPTHQQRAADMRVALPLAPRNHLSQMNLAIHDSELSAAPLALHGTAEDVGPPKKATPMELLNRNSTPDDDPLDVRGGAVGSGGAVEVTPARVVFSTDAGPAWVGGHYLALANIHPAELDAQMNAIFQEFGWASKILGQRVVASANSVEVYVCFDDMEDAEIAIDEVPMVTSAWSVHYITQHEYAGDGTAENTSFHDGQVMYIVKYSGDPNNVDRAAITKKLEAIANSFGRTLGFSVVHQDSTASHFRVEYQRISAARRAISELSASNACKYNDWTIFAQQIPDPYKPKSATKTSQTASKDGELIFSPSGRTAWRTGEDGDVVVEPPSHGPYHDAAVTYGNGSQSDGSHGFVPPSLPLTFGYDDPIHHSHPMAYAMVHRRLPGRSQAISLDDIHNGIDVRTTIMLRNVPNRWGYKQLKECIDATSFGKYDFSYLRMDFKRSTNVGYAFVNFTSAQDIIPLVKALVGREWQPGHYPRKVVVISYATIQGVECLIGKFRNSSVMSEAPPFRAKLWYTNQEMQLYEFAVKEAYLGRPYDWYKQETVTREMVGTERPFPASNNEIKQRRSTANATQNGLYLPERRGPPGYPHGGYYGGSRGGRSNYDRGTSAQLADDAYHGGECYTYGSEYFNSVAPFHFIPPPMTGPMTMPPQMSMPQMGVTQQKNGYTMVVVPPGAAWPMQMPGTSVAGSLQDGYQRGNGRSGGDGGTVRGYYPRSNSHVPRSLKYSQYGSPSGHRQAYDNTGGSPYKHNVDSNGNRVGVNGFY